jgi:hypothetical protein
VIANVSFASKAEMRKADRTFPAVLPMADLNMSGEKFALCLPAYQSRFELAIATDVAARNQRKLMRVVRCCIATQAMHLLQPYQHVIDVHREPPLDNLAPEKFGQERPRRPKSCSEMEVLGVGFESKCARNSGIFSRA